MANPRICEHDLHHPLPQSLAAMLFLDDHVAEPRKCRKSVRTSQANLPSALRVVQSETQSFSTASSSRRDSVPRPNSASKSRSIASRSRRAGSVLMKNPSRCVINYRRRAKGFAAPAARMMPLRRREATQSICPRPVAQAVLRRGDDAEAVAVWAVRLRCSMSPRYVALEIGRRIRCAARGAAARWAVPSNQTPERSPLQKLTPRNPPLVTAKFVTSQLGAAAQSGF